MSKKRNTLLWHSDKILRVMVFNATFNNISVISWQSREFESRPGDTSLWDKVCQRLAAGQWFYLGTPISSTNQSDCHEITDILLKVALNPITLNILSLWLLHMYMQILCRPCLWKVANDRELSLSGIQETRGILLNVWNYSS
jgi:hypothetical protein